MRLGAIVAMLALVGAAPKPVLVLTGDGVSAGAGVARFDRATRVQAIAVVAAALGPPVKQGDHGDCATDHVVHYTKFRGDFELSFVRGKLVGWTADAAGPKTAKGVGVGATLAAVRRAYPDIDTDAGDEANGGLGPSFQREGGPHGWLDGIKPTSKVIGLFAGATCIVG